MTIGGPYAAALIGIAAGVSGGQLCRMGFTGGITGGAAHGSDASG